MDLTKPKLETAPPKHGFKLDSCDDELDTYVAQVNGRADRYTLSLSDIVMVGDGLERALDDAGVPLIRRPGTTAVVRSAGPDKSRNTRQWSARGEGTEAHFRRYADGWRLMSAKRITVFGGQKQYCRISIDRRDYLAIQSRAVARFDVAVAAS